MIRFPDFNKAFEYENNFHMSSDISRLGKILAHYELYKMSREISGDIVECGVFKGNSLIRLATFRELFETSSSKKILGFDTFSKFPKNKFKADKKFRDKFLSDAGDQSIGKNQLAQLLKRKGIAQNVELIQGDVNLTIPKYLNSHPELKISLLNLDVDMYEPSRTILEYFYPRITKGGILVLDDYGTWPGETTAVDEYFADANIKIHKFSFCKTPSYIVKI
jgi:hypothetical protein